LAAASGNRLETREAFGSVDELLQRALAMSRQLRRFHLEYWPRLRNRDDFDTIYWLPASQRNCLERVYLNGRDFASQLSSLLAAFTDVGRYPTFESFVDAVEDFASTQPGRLQRTVAEAEKVLPELRGEAGALEPMLRLAGAQLAILAPLREWLEAAENGALHRQASRGSEPSSSTRMEPAAPAWRTHGWMAVAVLAAATGALLLALHL